MLAAEERQRIGSQISCSLCNLQHVHFFWSPGTRRLYARTVGLEIDAYHRAGRGRPGVPLDAWHVGTYTHGGVGSGAIMEDLLALLASPPALPAPPPPPRAPETSVATARPIPETTWEWAPVRFNGQPI